MHTNKPKKTPKFNCASKQINARKPKLPPNFKRDLQKYLMENDNVGEPKSLFRCDNSWVLELFQVSSIYKRGNEHQVHVFRCKTTLAWIVVCVLPRLQKVKRAHGYLSRLAEEFGFQHIRFLKPEELYHPALQPFAQLPHCITDKPQKECYSSLFKIFFNGKVFPFPFPFAPIFSFHSSILLLIQDFQKFSETQDSCKSQ